MVLFDADIAVFPELEGYEKGDVSNARLRDLSSKKVIKLVEWNAENNIDEKNVYEIFKDFKQVTSYRSLGLVLDAGESGTSLPATFCFSLPSNAKVRSVQVNPGRATINNGKRGMIGAVVFSSINVKSPYSTSINGKWSPREMDFRNKRWRTLKKVYI